MPLVASEKIERVDPHAARMPAQEKRSAQPRAGGLALVPAAGLLSLSVLALAWGRPGETAWGVLALGWAVSLPFSWWLSGRFRLPWLKPEGQGSHAPGGAITGAGGAITGAGGRDAHPGDPGRREGDPARLEEALRELGLLKAVLDAIPAPLFYKDPQGVYLGANAACERLLGRERSEIIGKGVYDTAPPELAAQYLAADRELLARGGEQVYESQVLYGDGARHDVIFYKAVFQAGGEVRGIVGTLLDITERKGMEARLKMLSQAVEQSPSIVVLTDAQGTIQYVNRKFVEVTGYASEEALGANPRILKAGTTPDEVYRDLWTTITAGKEWRGEFRNRKKNGQPYQEMAIISPVLDGRGKVTHYLALKEDVTERRALARALRHAQKMESLGTLTGGVAHDFNNILTAIIGYANLIQMKVVPEDPCSRFAEQVVASAEKAAVLTRGLLAYSRNQEMNPAHLDLNEVVARVDRLLSRVLGEAISLSTALNREPLRLYADSSQLEQMLMNLALNAKEAMPEGGTLEIRTEPWQMDEEFVRRKGFGSPGSYALLSVADSGVGLDQATRERIFEPFFTTHGTGGGPGLGLSIVHGIVEQHQGRIEVESAPGEGTVFRIYLPLALPSPAAQPSRSAERGGETVLLVEDNPEVRAIIGEVLRGAGYLVLEAADSEEGLKRFLAQGAGIRLLLVDVIMPGKGGLELYREIRTRDPQLRVLFMSGYPEEEIRARGVVAKDVAFISKPLAPADLLKKVRTVLDG